MSYLVSFFLSYFENLSLSLKLPCKALTMSSYHLALCLSRFQSHQNQLLMGGLGGNRLNWTNFETPSFLAILRDPAGDPHRAGRSGGVWQVRSCIAFSQTLHGPRGFPRDWVSKQSAFEHCRFSSFQTSCI